MVHGNIFWFLSNFELSASKQSEYRLNLRVPHLSVIAYLYKVIFIGATKIAIPLQGLQVLSIRRALDVCSTWQVGLQSALT